MSILRNSTWLVLVSVVVAVVGGAVVFRHFLGFETVKADATGETKLDYTFWNNALGRWVIDGKVDYDRLLSEKKDLEVFAAMLASTGPLTAPQDFANDDGKLAYYINAYNAFTLLGVVSHWPIDSVQDVRGRIEPKAGFGFFYGLRFLLDGRKLNLYNFEHRIIRGFGDARIHAAINCASVSCPALQPFAYTPEALDEQLDLVTREFCSSPQHIRVDDAKRRVVLSAIFDWYRMDFEEHARRLGVKPSVEGFMIHFADDDTRAALERAFNDGYAIEYAAYDWRLNRL